MKKDLKDNSWVSMRVKEVTKEIIRFEQQKAKEYEPYKIFYDHVRAHFEKEHPYWKVMCKICDKNFDEIVKEELKKKHGVK